MQADKAGRGQQPSNSLRISQKSTTRLSDSARLMGTLTHQPESSDDDVSVSLQLPSDGTGESLSVRPAPKLAVQVFGSLSRVGKKLRDSQEAQANKRTQSQAGIGAEGDDDRGTAKRLRTSDTSASKGAVQDNPVSQPAPQAIAQPATPSVTPPSTQAVPQSVAQTVPQTFPQTVAQPVAQVMAVPHAPAFGMTPDMQAQIAMAESLRMVNSIQSFQPEKISELFQHLCRAQLWPLLKLEEQRVVYLMNIQNALQATYGVAGVPVSRRAMNIDPSSSSTTTTTTTQAVSPSPIPVAVTSSTPTGTVAQRAQRIPKTQRALAPVAQVAEADSASNVSMIHEALLPDPANPRQPENARGLLESLPEGTQRWMKKPAGEIKKMLGMQHLDLASTNNMAAFTCLLVEIASHGGLPHLDGEIDGIVQAFLQRYLTSHRHREPENRPKVNIDAENRKVRIGKDPAYAQLLRLLPKYPQFARALGIGLNNLQVTHRTHLGISRKFNAVLALMKETPRPSQAVFNARLEKILKDLTSPETSPKAAASNTTSTPTSTPTSARNFRLEGGEDEGSDGEI